MTIEVYSSEKPFFVEDLSTTSLLAIMLFMNKQTITNKSTLEFSTSGQETQTLATFQNNQSFEPDIIGRLDSKISGVFSGSDPINSQYPLQTVKKHLEEGGYEVSAVITYKSPHAK